MGNTINDWMTTATIMDGARREWWLEWFGSPTAPIISIVATLVNVSKYGEVEAYMLDLDAITDERKEKLMQGLAKAFGMTEDDARLELIKGVPILAENVSVSTRDPGIMFSLIDETPFDFLEDLDPDDDQYLDYEED